MCRKSKRGSRCGSVQAVVVADGSEWYSVMADGAASVERVAERETSEGATFHVVGIGNALVDVITHADEEFLTEYELVKGSMTLVETDRALELYQAIGTKVEMSGGSTANTVCGVASLGGNYCVCRESLR